jgi:hypothetical protein
MPNLELGDRIELSYEDSPAMTIRATVCRGWPIPPSFGGVGLLTSTDNL